jgi:hypothetical protein
MRLKATMVMAVSVLAVSLSAAPAVSAAAGSPGKAPTKGHIGAADKSLLHKEAAARKAANPALQADLAALQSRIAAHVKKHGTKNSFGSFINPATGRIVVESDAPASVISALTAPSRARGHSVEFRSTKISDSYSRKSDIPSYWGGAGVTASVGTPWCSTGFTVQNGAGTRSQVTAGHCFSNGQNTYTENGGLFMGSVSGNGLPVGQDMELIGGSSYWGYIYTGGVDSSTGLPLVGAGDPVVGYADYCHSGRTTGENCGHTATSVTAQVCTQTGCKSPVIAFTGGVLPAGGDSGSPFYVKTSTSVWARGIVIAGGGGTAYAEKWSRIASRFGVSIVTA